MKEKTNSYDWTAYYRSLYEEERKKNMLLAGKLADTEAKEADIAFRLQNIENNKFWKVSMPIRKCYHALFSRKVGADGETGAETAKASQSAVTDAAQGYKTCEKKHGEAEVNTRMPAEAYMQEYRQEVYRQKHPYLQWIAGYEEPDDGTESIKAEDEYAEEGTEYLVDGWKVITIEDCDVYVILCGCGMIDKRIENKIKSCFNKVENCLFAYADEDYYWETLSNRMHPWYKPCWSPDTMLSFCYMGHMIIAKRTLCNDLLRETRYQAGSYADFYDLCLRIEERAHDAHGVIFHIEDVLFHNRYEPGEEEIEEIAKARREGGDVLETVEKLLQSELEQGRDMIGCSASFRSIREAALQRRGIKAHLEPGPVPDIYHVVYEMPKNDFISVIIPSKDHPDVLERCLRSFRERTEYENYEWIVVDNGSNPENRSRIEALQKEYGFLYLYEPMEFNFSAMCNLGAKRAKGDFLLLLNDDMEIIEKDWLRIMAGAAAQPHAGAVGAKLWYAGSETIQHTGITNLDIGPSHKLVTFADDKNYYYGRNLVTYDMIGVTAAALMIERRKYQEAGGMDESMKVAYNDVDLCFKLLEAGYYNILRNDAVLYHAESLSRGLDEQDDGKWERLLQEKEKLYAKHPQMQGKDSFYHKNLIDNASHYACNFKFDYQDNLKTTTPFLENEGNLAEAQNGVLQLTVDRAEKQHKIHREEPDIMFVMGWSYMPGKDNAKYARKLVLQQEDGTLYTTDLCPWSRWDVEAVLTGEVNISLAGFVVRIKKEKLHFGDWRIGMLATDLDTHQQFLTWSDKKMTVD